MNINTSDFDQSARRMVSSSAQWTGLFHELEKDLIQWDPCDVRVHLCFLVHARVESSCIKTGPHISKSRLENEFFALFFIWLLTSMVWRRIGYFSICEVRHSKTEYQGFGLWTNFLAGSVRWHFLGLLIQTILVIVKAFKSACYTPVDIVLKFSGAYPMIDC